MVTITTTTDAEAEAMAVLMTEAAPAGVSYAVYLNGKRVAGRAAVQDARNADPDGQWGSEPELRSR